MASGPKCCAGASARGSCPRSTSALGVVVAGAAGRDAALQTAGLDLELFAAFLRTVGPWLPRASHRARQSRRGVSGKIAERDRDDLARRVGQSRPRRRRIRACRPAVRGRSGRPRLHRLHAGHRRAFQAAARRRQAGADLCRASRQLGTAGHRSPPPTGSIRSCCTAAPI